MAVPLFFATATLSNCSMKCFGHYLKLSKNLEFSVLPSVQTILCLSVETICQDEGLALKATASYVQYF